MKKVRVLEVFDSLEISGGVQMVIMNVLRNIDREKVQIDFAVYDLPEKDSYKQEAEALGVNIYKIDNVSFIFNTNDNKNNNNNLPLIKKKKTFIKKQCERHF